VHEEKTIMKKCVAVNTKVKGYTEAVVDNCNSIKERLESYKKFGEYNKLKKVYKLGKKL